MKELNIKTVAVSDGQVVQITWASGKLDRVDLTALIADLDGLAVLDDIGIFDTVAIGEEGRSLIWTNGAEIGTDALWRMAREQAGEATPIEEFTAWRTHNRLSLSDAALALGITRRMVAYYEAGRYLIPRMVGLACKGWEADHHRHV